MARAVTVWAAAGPICQSASPAAEKRVACLLGPRGDGQKLDEALAAMLGHCQCKAAVCF